LNRSNGCITFLRSPTNIAFLLLCRRGRTPRRQGPHDSKLEPPQRLRTHILRRQQNIPFGLAAAGRNRRATQSSSKNEPQTLFFSPAPKYFKQKKFDRTATYVELANIFISSKSLLFSNNKPFESTPATSVPFLATDGTSFYGFMQQAIPSAWLASLYDNNILPFVKTRRGPRLAFKRMGLFVHKEPRPVPVAGTPKQVA